MHIAFVKHAKDDVDREHGRGDQEGLAGERGLERLGITLKLAVMAEGKPTSRLAASMAFTAWPSEAPGARLNEERHRREGRLVVDDQRARPAQR